MRGIGLTISQMSLLGMTSVIVLDPFDPQHPGNALDLKSIFEQVDRTVTSIDEHEHVQTMKVVNALEIVASPTTSLSGQTGKVRVARSQDVLQPTKREIISILAPVAWNAKAMKVEKVPANDVLLALAHELSGVAPTMNSVQGGYSMVRSSLGPKSPLAVDRVIVLDPLGNIPSSDPSEGSHIFVNLMQEYDDIQSDLKRSKSTSKDQIIADDTAEMEMKEAQAFITSNPISAFLEEEGYGKTSSPMNTDAENLDLPTTAADIHSANLKLLKDILLLLPKSSSGLVTTPAVAAKTARTSEEETLSSRGIQRRRGNLLIRNLLTDKPLESSSLPRRPQNIPPATFVKRGCDLSIIPDPRTHPWIPPSPGSPPALTLDDPRIDTARLITLIEDSFGRALDFKHYAERIANNLAGIIIAGPYEGCAILTWEYPSLSLSRGNHFSHQIQPVCYLDKFAILKSAQGAGGISDIIWKSMVRDCFPNGIVWRSRKENKVNKWYAARSKGNVDVEGTGWRMFWTSDLQDGDFERGGVWDGYEAVCKGVEASWADQGKPE